MRNNALTVLALALVSGPGLLADDTPLETVRRSRIVRSGAYRRESPPLGRRSGGSRSSKASNDRPWFGLGNIPSISPSGGTYGASQSFTWNTSGNPGGSPSSGKSGPNQVHSMPEPSGTLELAASTIGLGLYAWQRRRRATTAATPANTRAPA
jgi:hypothetical protein